MRINVIFRSFSGLENSFRKKNWEPVGSPVLINFIKYLDKTDKLQILLVGENTKNKFLVREFSFKNLRSKIIFINKKYFNHKIIIGKIFNNLITFILILYKSILFKPQAHYVDNQNMIFGAIFTIFHKNVNLRLLGSWGVTFELKRKNFFSKIRKYFYGFNFKSIICTDDGSNFKYVLKSNLFSKKTKIFHLLNGCEFIKFKNYLTRSSKKKLKILHYGRFDIDKGIDLFLLSIKKTLEENKNMIFTLIGYGKYYNEVKNFIKINKLTKNVKLHYKLNYKEIEKHLNNTDLYISSNLIGALSNSNLEAIGYGIPAIFVNTKDKKNFTLKKKIKKNFFYYSEINFVNNLKKLILRYEKNRNLLKKNSLILKSQFKKILINWKSRIEIERKILSK